MAGGSDGYRRRIERRLGMTMEEAKRQGISLAAARGHKPNEHRTRKQRAIARGDLTEDQRVYLRRQSQRSQNPEAWLLAELAFRQANHDHRETLRLEQHRLASGYRRKVGGRRRGSNPMRSGKHGFVAPDLDMGLAPNIEPHEFPLVFYH